MKKILKLSVVLAIGIFAFQVSACPHVDKHGESHFQFYNEDYTIMTMLFPRVDYAYSKDIPLDSDATLKPELEDSILTESFTFPIIQDLTSYRENYYFVDKRLQEDEWEQYDYRIDIKELKDIEVMGSYFKMGIELKSIYDNHLDYITTYSNQMFYRVNVDELFNEKNNDTLIKLQQANIKAIDDRVSKLSFEYLVRGTKENGYEVISHNIINLVEPVIITLNQSDQINDNCVVIDASKHILREEYIELSYDESINQYSFEISTTGTYLVVDKDTLTEEAITLFNDSTSKPSNLFSYLIYALIAAGLAILGFVGYRYI